MKVPSLCHARLPNVGLGNKLFVWAKAQVFAKLNSLPLFVSGWTQLQLGPLLRGGDLRLYWNYFERVDDLKPRARKLALRSSTVVPEPPVQQMNIEREGVVYEFSRIPSWADYFGDIRDHRAEVQKALLAMLTERRRTELSHYDAVPISAHIRLGDFRKLRSNEKFSQVGGVRTPLDYFARLIAQIREVRGSNLPVEVASDGGVAELQQLLKLPNVQLAPKRSSIVDILCMSKSDVLITSAGSTFSYWAAFLGEAATIMHPDHVHAPIRPQSVNFAHFEGAVGPETSRWPDLLLSNIAAIGRTPSHQPQREFV